MPTAMPASEQRMLYAAYGSNLHPARLAARIPGAVLMGTAELADWQLTFDKRGQDGSAKCNIVAAEDTVHVAVYQLTAAARAALDQIEGLGRGYEHAHVHLASYGECLTYVAAAGWTDDQLQPFTWYLQLVLTGCDYHGFPRDYRERIAAQRALPDPDARRARDYRALLKKLQPIS